MKYNKLSLSGEEKEIGVYPQCKGMPSGMGFTKAWFDRPNSFTHLNNEDFPDFEPDFIWELEDKAYLTDVVSPSNISANGFLINEKVKEIFSHFNLIEHRIYPATLIVKGDRMQYYWLHFKANREFFLENIDYEKSSFHIRNMAFMKVEDIEINSYEEYVNKNKELPFTRRISASKLVFNELVLEKEYDILFINSMFLETRISKRLTEVLKAHNVIGLDIKEQNIL